MLLNFPGLGKFSNDSWGKEWSVWRRCSGMSGAPGDAHPLSAEPTAGPGVAAPGQVPFGMEHLGLLAGKTKQAGQTFPRRVLRCLSAVMNSSCAGDSSDLQNGSVQMHKHCYHNKGDLHIHSEPLWMRRVVLYTHKAGSCVFQVDCKRTRNKEN